MLKTRKNWFVILICILCFTLFFNVNSFSASENWFSSYYDWGKNVIREIFTGKVFNKINYKLYRGMKYVSDNMLCEIINKEIEKVTNEHEEITCLPVTVEEELRIFFKEILNMEMKEFQIERIEKNNSYFALDHYHLGPFEPWLRINVKVDGNSFFCEIGTDYYKKIFYFINDEYFSCNRIISDREVEMEENGFFDISWGELGPEEVAWENVKRVLKYCSLPEDKEKMQVWVTRDYLYCYTFKEFMWENTPVRGSNFECCIDGFTGKVTGMYYVQPYIIRNNKPQNIISFEKGKQIAKGWLSKNKKEIDIENISPRLVIAPNLFTKKTLVDEGGYLPLNVLVLYKICKLLNLYECRCRFIETNFLEEPGYYYAYEMLVNYDEQQKEILLISPDTEKVIGFFPENHVLFY